MPEKQEKVEEPQNKVAKASMDAISAENEMMKRSIQEKDAMIEKLSVELKEANEVLTAQAKSKLIKEIVPHSKLPVDELQAKTIDELKNIKIAVDSATPSSPNIHFDAIESDRLKGLTVGSLYGKKQGEQ
jgi:hypothetical protein